MFEFTRHGAVLLGWRPDWETADEKLNYNSAGVGDGRADHIGRRSGAQRNVESEDARPSISDFKFMENSPVCNLAEIEARYSATTDMPF
ncbi:MAG: hypothetical protein DMG70_15750 [Acidobacteria bacterium]|nr:MAG: hypothetical protein DMG70_15750 [Acidobacteriota bacterium]PYY07676.1 MAG: hypothetical protein DMG69_17885 [Acidobacteriota bacterium]